MKHTKATGRILTAAGVFAVFILSGAGAGTLPETAKLLPPETVFLLKIDNFEQLKAQFEKTTFYKLYKDPAMTAFVEDCKRKSRQKTAQLQGALPDALLDGDILPKGRLCFALVLDRRAVDANEPSALVAVQFGDNISRAKELTEKTVKEAIENGSHRRTENYRGLSIETITAKDSSRLGYGFSSTLSYCFIDDCLLGSEDIELLKFAIAQVQGSGGTTLADDQDYIAATAAVGPYHDIDLFINIKQLVKVVAGEDTTGQARREIAALGFDGVAAAAWSLGLARIPGRAWSGKAIVRINGAKRGICKILEFKSTVFRTPAFIPAPAYLVTIINMDINKAYNELYNLLSVLEPAAAAAMNTPILPPAGPQQPPQIQLKSDIIEYLGSQIVISQSLNKSSSPLPVPQYLFAVGVNNRDALEKSMSLLHSRLLAFNNPDARRELLGHTIYLVEPRAFPWFRPGPAPLQAPGGTEAKQMPVPAFTVTDTHLIFGLESTVEAAIRLLVGTDVASVESAEWFQHAKSSVPSTVGLAGMENTAVSIELFWKLLKQSAKKQDKDSSMPTGPNPRLQFARTGLEMFDPGLLPEFDVVRKYFGSSIFYAISRPDGFFFEFTYLTAPADR